MCSGNFNNDNWVDEEVDWTSRVDGVTSVVDMLSPVEVVG